MHLNTYATTLAAYIFQMLIAIIAVFSLEAHQYDTVSTFTNSILDEVIYCTCPEGYIVVDHYLLLFCALYRLHHLLLLWLKEFSRIL